MFEQAACHGKAATVKAAAIEALAITAFVASDDPSVVDKCMTGFANLWKAGELLLILATDTKIYYIHSHNMLVSHEHITSP